MPDLDQAIFAGVREPPQIEQDSRAKSFGSLDVASWSSEGRENLEQPVAVVVLIEELQKVTLKVATTACFKACPNGLDEEEEVARNAANLKENTYPKVRAEFDTQKLEVEVKHLLELIGGVARDFILVKLRVCVDSELMREVEGGRDGTD